MDPVALTVGAGWVAAGLVCRAVAAPLIRGAVRPNALYGIRLPESFQSDEAWFAINRFGGKQIARWSVSLVLVGVACLFLPLRSHVGLTLVLGFAPLLFLLVPVVRTWRFARREFPRR